MQERAIRGAITVASDNADEIRTACSELVSTIIRDNDLAPEDIITIFITITEDLRSLNPSASIRTTFGWNDVAFFTSQEPTIDGMLARCIRVLIQCQSKRKKSEIRHVYLRDAAKLRPDLTNH
jgi:chorismate mutase